MYQRTIEQMEQDLRQKVIIDIRKEADYRKETYPGARNIYGEEFERYLEELPKDQPIYLICYTGENSLALAQEISGRDYEIYSVEGGYREYLKRSLFASMRKGEEPDGRKEQEDRCKEIERSIVQAARIRC